MSDSSEPEEDFPDSAASAVCLLCEFFGVRFGLQLLRTMKQRRPNVFLFRSPLQRRSTPLSKPPKAPLKPPLEATLEAFEALLEAPLHQTVKLVMIGIKDFPIRDALVLLVVIHC